MKCSETPDSFKPIRDSYISDRWGQLAELQQTWSERIIRYLVLVNAGGVVAVLTFMGATATKNTADQNWVHWMLVLFVLGLIAVGVLQIYSQHRHDWLYLRWREGVTRFQEDKITWFELTEGDVERSRRSVPFYVLIHVSFALFLMACAIGAWNLLIC